MDTKQSKQETGLAAAGGNTNTLATSGFAVLANTDFSAMVSNELDGLDISFERVKIPSGGSTAFELPTEGEDIETVKEFSAVILNHHPLNAYYTEKYTGGSNPPDCGSFDGRVGTGDPGGSCVKCPLNQFGTDDNGNGGKACKNKRRVYILREGELFPLLLTLPTGSLKGFTKYLKTLLSKGKASNAVVTRFALKKVMNAGGIAYSQATFAFDRALTPEEYALIQPLSEQVKAYAHNVAFDDAAGDDGAGYDSNGYGGGNADESDGGSFGDNPFDNLEPGEIAE